MSDLSAEIKRIEKSLDNICSDWLGVGSQLTTVRMALMELKRLASIGAPTEEHEIVRCEDCKHLFDGEHNANCCEVLMRKAKWLIEITVDMNWYCADGKRRGDG